MMVRDVASGLGKGLVAGFIGTAVMTVSSTLEMKLTGRGASDTPARAAGKVLGVQPRDPDGEQRFSQIAHFAYGTSWGAVRGLLEEFGIRGAAAGAVHFLMVWGAAQAMLPGLGVAPPATEWDAEELATDLFHHAVYAAATNAAYEFIDTH